MCGESMEISNEMKLDPWKRTMAGLRERLETDQQTEYDSTMDIDQDAPSPLPYDGLLGLVAQELVTLLATRLGRLGCDDKESRTTFFSPFQIDDYPSSVAGMPPMDSNPVDEIHEQFRFQLIDMFFNTHPLCMIISKTLFLRSYKDGNYDTALLAAIMAGALHSYKITESSEKEARLFEYAEMLLNERSSQSWDLPTAQVMILIGWHELCTRRSQRAIYFIAYAGRIATAYLQQTTMDNPVPKGRANGVDIDSVEAEMIRNLYWTCFSLTLWAFLEVGEPFACLLPKRLPPEFPAVDETSSAMIELDLASDNVSTFQSQARAIRGLWPLAHIASTVGHIYALSPSDHDHRSPFQDVSWQLKPLHQLRCLLRLNNDLESLCQSVQKVLQDAIQGVQREVRNEVSKTLVTAAYLTLMIHLDFPKTQMSDESAVKVTPLLLDHLIRSAGVLSNIIKRVVSSQTSRWLLSTGPTTPSGAIPLAEIFSSGLDVVGRAATHILSRLQTGSRSEHQCILAHLSRLSDLTHGLYCAAKEDPMRSSKRARSAKKALKNVHAQISSIEQQHGLRTEAWSARHSSTSSISGLSDLDTTPRSARGSVSDPPDTWSNAKKPQPVDKPQNKKRPAPSRPVSEALERKSSLASRKSSIASSAFAMEASKPAIPTEQTMQSWPPELEDTASILGTDLNLSAMSDMKPPPEAPSMNLAPSTTEPWNDPALLLLLNDPAMKMDSDVASLPPPDLSSAAIAPIAELDENDLMLTDNAFWDSFGVDWEQVPTA